MANFFLLAKLFVMTKFFLVTIFLPFRDHFVNHPCCEYVYMADNNNSEMNEDESDLIKSYFFQGFEYKDILRFLSHGISMSKTTLKRRLKECRIQY